MREEGLAGKTSKKLEMGRMVEVRLRMKGGGMKKKSTKIGNHWESLASGGEVRDRKKRRSLREMKQKVTSCCRTS